MESGHDNLTFEEIEPNKHLLNLYHRTTVRCKSWFSRPLNILLLLLTCCSSSIFRTDLKIKVFWKAELKAQCLSPTFNSVLQIWLSFNVLSSHYTFATLNYACSQTLKLFMCWQNQFSTPLTGQHKKSGLDVWGGRKKKKKNIPKYRQKCLTSWKIKS